uniref:Protein kinase domain-containing protein n=1 Tax=Kalanchoe fedtschenkoi TaxID=63787 RepID=A0A7N0T3P1_KALFE
MQVGFFLATITSATTLLLLTSPATATSPAPTRPAVPADAAALLAFQARADLSSTLGFSPRTASLFCKWRGVDCVGGRVFRFVLENFHLGGYFAAHTLTNLDQLRVLSLQNNSLTGSIPDLSPLLNLKTLFLDHNRFNGSFPPSLSTLHRIRTIDLSYNYLAGEIPAWLTGLDRLYSLRLDRNFFNGSIPPLNQTGLQIFNVSGNDLSGPIPLTPTLLDFGVDSFSGNPYLCGEIIGKECHPGAPFFKPSLPASELSPPPAGSLGQNAQVRGVEFTSPSPRSNHKREASVIGFVVGLFFLLGLTVFLAVALKRKMSSNRRKTLTPEIAADSAAAENAAALIRIEEENELEEKVKKVQGMKAGKSGNLVFCAGEAHLYTMDQLMTASAEMLGRGTMGTTYKAVLENRLIVTVKRLDASKTAGTNREMLERQLESIGGLRHPNLVPLRAYLLAQDERLLIYDYQPNGSLFSLIHGSKSTRAKPLHWTSCLKLAEDVAQGLSYIHQAWRLVHDDINTIGYKAPEIRKTNQNPTPKSDVYSFGVLLLELLTGKLPSKHPYLMPDELLNWVRSTREENGGEDDNSLVMLVEVAIACSMASPEQRPTMWQVLKMIQEIKESVFVEDSESEPPNGNLI